MEWLPTTEHAGESGVQFVEMPPTSFLLVKLEGDQAAAASYQFCSKSREKLTGTPYMLANSGKSYKGNLIFSTFKIRLIDSVHSVAHAQYA